MKISHVLCASLLPFLALGCDPPPPPGAHVDSFRVLAEQVDQPYARPGETVQLSSLSFDPEGRAISWAWASCVNPASSDLDGCLNAINAGPDPTSAVFAMGDETSAPQLTIPDDAISGLPQAAHGAAS
ncbi:MAG TPA: hypothetical protein VNG33_16835, partial [Polyangiaceae bacterium]|nr:hypothetical protein [Polyangiaceae bacterium]